MLWLGLLASFISVAMQMYPCYEQSLSITDLTVDDPQTLQNISYPQKTVNAPSCSIRVELPQKKGDCSGPLAISQEGVDESHPDSCLVEGDWAITCYCSYFIATSCNSLESLFQSTSVRVKEIPCIRRRLFQLFQPNSTDYEALLDKMNKDLDDNEMTRTKAAPTDEKKYIKMKYLYNEENISSALGGQFASILMIFFLLYSICVFFAIGYFSYILAKKYYPHLRKND